MRYKIIIIGVLATSILSLFTAYTQTYAADVTASETCNVQVKFTATVPNSIEQGKSFIVSNITVSPSNSYGFNVVSSIFDMTATNTSSATYSQNFYATTPSPTSGHSTYVASYPNWSLDAAGPVGSSIKITLKKSLTVIQGYSGSPVTCNFTKTLATIPITAPSPVSTPSTAPTPSSQPSSQPQPSNPSTTVTTSSPSTGSVDPASTTQQTNAATKLLTSDDSSKATNTSSAKLTAGVTVVPLNVEVMSSTGAKIDGANVTLDDTKTLTTNSGGLVVFSNVLTGNHTLLVTYKGQQTTSKIQLSTSNTGKIFIVNLPTITPPLNLAAIAAGSVAAIAIATPLAFFALKRRRASSGSPSSQGQPAITLPGIIAGTAVTAPVTQPTTHIPAIPMFALRPIVTTPAPWAPPASMPVTPADQPAQPAPQPSQPPANLQTIPITKF